MEAIFKKPLDQVPVRLQRMRLVLQRYDLIVKCKPGKELVLADFLSRHPTSEQVDFKLSIRGLSCVAVSDGRLEELRRATREDRELAILQQLYMNGWPTDKKQVPDEVHQYWSKEAPVTGIKKKSTVKMAWS